jgi:hypothetical protein
MILLETPLSEREPIEVLELNYYRFRLQDDALVRAMEKIQAAAVELVAISEQPGPASVHAEAASKSLMAAYQGMAQERVEIEATIKGLKSYLTMHEVELFDTMQELLLAQDIIKEEMAGATTEDLTP